MDVFVMFLLIAFYFLPWLIALMRKRRNVGQIFVANLFLGWTFIGWIVCLVWSFGVDN